MSSWQPSARSNLPSAPPGRPATAAIPEIQSCKVAVDLLLGPGSLPIHPPPILYYCSSTFQVFFTSPCGAGVLLPRCINI